MTIGPQVPSHLLAANNDDDADDDAYGPPPPPEAGLQRNSVTAQPRTAGPQFPAHLPRTRPSSPPRRPAPAETDADKDEEDEDEDEDEEAYGPMLPPGHTTRPPQPLQPKRILGPARPGPASYSNDDSDEEVGPMPAPAGPNKDGPDDDPVREFIAREERRMAAVEAARAPKKPVREEWMLVPPSSSSVLGSLDPTKLKARQFSRTARPAVGVQDNSLWTETPAERQARIKDEVDGKRRRATDVADADADAREGDRKRRRHDEAISAQVAQYNQETRSQSLVDLHKAAKDNSKEEKDAGIWDHARDMSVGGRLMDEGQRSKMITDSRALGDRFGKSKSGGWL